MACPRRGYLVSVTLPAWAGPPTVHGEPNAHETHFHPHRTYLHACVQGIFAEVKPFTFVQISDTHTGSPGNNADLTAVLKDIGAHYPDAAFIVNTGDLTDYGSADELHQYAELIKASPTKLHSIAGNHDSRWADNGKESFKEIVGPTFLTWEQDGVKFIGMDVSMLLEQYAHFDGQQMARLKEELEGLKPGQPAVICVHHPPLSDGRYFDNDQEFADLIRQHNVPLVLMGHGHSLQRYTLNNTTFAMGGASMQRRVYRVFRVKPDSIEMITRNAAKDKADTEDSVPTQRVADGIGALEVVQASDPAEGAPVAFKLSLPDGFQLASATWTVDGFLTGTAEIAGGGVFKVDPATMPNGTHQMVVTMADARGAKHLRSARFATEAQRAGDKPGPRVAREFKLLSGSQSNPAAADGVLYVGSNDARLRAISLADGATLWERDLNREIVSSPAVTTESVVVGSLDGKVYCLDRKTGKTMWEVKTGRGGAGLAPRRGRHRVHRVGRREPLRHRPRIRRREVEVRGGETHKDDARTEQRQAVLRRVGQLVLLRGRRDRRPCVEGSRLNPRGAWRRHLQPRRHGQPRHRDDA